MPTRRGKRRASEATPAEVEHEPEVEPPPTKGRKGNKGGAQASARAAEHAEDIAAAADKEKRAADLEKAAEDAKELEERKKQTLEQLRAVERQIFNLETQYFEATNPQGNALRGYEGLISSVGINMKKMQFKAEDRIFSSSSVTGGFS